MPAADQANASQADPPGLTVSVSVSALQHLIIEVLRRPVEFTEVARVRDEIFAKAEEVQQLAEQSAAISAWVVSTANRLVGESFQEQLLQRRDELLAMLIDLDVAPERRIAIVMPITRAVANDYRMNILSEARHAVVDAISGTKQQVDAIIREVVAPLENPDQQTGLLELRRHAEQHNLKLEGFHSAVDRYDRLLEQNPDLVE